jgi:hypothetical protein
MPSMFVQHETCYMNPNFEQIFGSGFVFQKAYNARIKAIHYVNVPSSAEMIISFMRTVMKPKIAARVSYCCSHMTRAVLLHTVTKQPRQYDKSSKL